MILKAVKRKLDKRSLKKERLAQRLCVDRMRNTVYQHVKELHHNVVAYGPFKGMSLTETAFWGTLDHTGQILGTYERHIIDYILSLELADDSPFIDVGAADGYHAVGMALTGRFAKVIAFELTDLGRQSLAERAKANGVEIDIREAATSSTIEALVQQHHGGVILIDIEGAEYDILTSNTLHSLRNFNVIVELHVKRAEDNHRRELLIQRAGKHFHASILRRAPFPVDKFRELDGFDDHHRMLAFSEGRVNSMPWLVLNPQT